MPVTTYFGNAVLNHMLRGQSFTPPSTVWVGLFTQMPTADGGGQEVSGGGYVRQPATFAPAANREISNDTDLQFPTATADWGTVVGFGLFDAETGGNLLVFASLSTPKNVLTGDQPYFPTGELTVTIS
ncbi:MAG TPA: hypothetical protein VIK99_08520 [Thermaerobacter sp.]